MPTKFRKIAAVLEELRVQTVHYYLQLMAKFLSSEEHKILTKIIEYEIPW